MKIQSKVILGFGLLILLILVLFGTTVKNLSNLSNQLDETYTERYAKMKLAYNIRAEVNDIATGLVNIIWSEPNENLNQKLASLESSIESASDSFVILASETGSEADQQIIDDIMENGSSFLTYKDEVIALVLAGRTEEAANLRTSMGLTIQQDLLESINNLTQHHERTMDSALQQTAVNNHETLNIVIASSVVGLLLGLGIMMWNIMSIKRGSNKILRMINDFSNGTLHPEVNFQADRKDEFGLVATVFNDMAKDLEIKTEQERLYKNELEKQSWIKSNLVDISNALQGINDVSVAGQTLISQVVPMIDASYGTIYVVETGGTKKQLKLSGTYAFNGESIQSKETVAFGEGLVGQCALERKKISLQQIPSDYIKVHSGLGETAPRDAVIYPVGYEGRLFAVIELASLQSFSQLHSELLEQLSYQMGIFLNDLFARIRMEELLRESQTQTEELQTQSEELLAQQEELKRANEALKNSEETLQRQQEELETSNEELEYKTKLLEMQVKQTEQKNDDIEKTKKALEQQTIQLTKASKYKSEFLTNMSHELRTPLNSLLILSHMLMENKEGNLTEKQVEFSSTIHSSGKDLLKLIDEILDLSKIDAGKMNMVREDVSISELVTLLDRSFKAIANRKSIDLQIEVGKLVPDTIFTDPQRLQQILKNLISNAIKFTHQGFVKLSIQKEDTDSMISFAVIDTGIGIPEDKKDFIFEAFQQADGTTSRKYGGTGLGLSISRELARLLGGNIRLESKEGQGSTFTFRLPEFYVAEQGEPSDIQTDTEIVFYQSAPTVEYQPHSVVGVEDDLDNVGTNDKVLLIIEDDVSFAKILLDMARSKGFKGIVALQGDKGLEYAQDLKPDAILLDIQLPVMDGWSILNHLKNNKETRHIPVHVISVVDEIGQGLSMGAMAYLEKPAGKEELDEAFNRIKSFINRGLKRLLIVEDDAVERKTLVELVGHDDVLITAVSTGAEALSKLGSEHYDCMVLDLGLPDISGFELLDQIRDDKNLRNLPIIVYTGKELDSKEELELKKYAKTIIIKDAKSPERLLDETALFLHRVEADLPEDKRNMLRKLHDTETIFAGKKVMIVEDDIRNVYALSSVLESYKMEIFYAENGREALELLEEQPDLDLILMDIMMPEMDGYETMRAIRKMEQFKKLPIIALTAKAMKDDRDKCIEAGAFDYISKPIHMEQLLSLMRVWLYQ